MVPLDENVQLCLVGMKFVIHSGCRSHLLLSAARCGHPFVIYRIQCGPGITFVLSENYYQMPQLSTIGHLEHINVLFYGDDSVHSLLNFVHVFGKILLERI